MQSFLYPNLPKYFDVSKVDIQTVYGDLLTYTSQIKFLLEQRDTQINASPATKIYKVLDLGTIKSPKTGDVAYESSTEAYWGYTSAAGWQKFNGGLGARGYFGTYYSNDLVCITSVGEEHAVSLSPSDGSYGVTVTNGTHIKVQYNGLYNIQVSYQFFNSDPAVGEGITWFKRNGTALSDSASYGAVTGKHGTTDGALILSYNIIVSLSANDYIETCWTSDVSSVHINNRVSVGNVPNSPSVILTINQV